MKIFKRMAMVIIFVLLAFVYLNCLLMDLWPILYPEPIRDVAGVVSIVVSILWLVWIVVVLIKKYKKK